MSTNKELNANVSKLGTNGTITQQICPQCGHAYDGEKCWECVARMADIDETFSLCLPVALGGILIGYIFSIGTFPPLITSNAVIILIIPVLFLAGAIIFVLMLGQLKSRYSNFVRLTILLVTISFLLPGVYFFLNGILDGGPAGEVPARVISKGIGGRGGPTLSLDLLWNQKNIGLNLRVRHDEYTAVAPGDLVRLVIHPGAFSQPWYGDVQVGN